MNFQYTTWKNNPTLINESGQWNSDSTTWDLISINMGNKDRTGVWARNNWMNLSTPSTIRITIGTESGVYTVQSVDSTNPEYVKIQLALVSSTASSTDYIFSETEIVDFQLVANEDSCSDCFTWYLIGQTTLKYISCSSGETYSNVITGTFVGTDDIPFYFISAGQPEIIGESDNIILENTANFWGKVCGKYNEPVTDQGICYTYSIVSSEIQEFFGTFSVNYLDCNNTEQVLELDIPFDSKNSPWLRQINSKRLPVILDPENSIVANIFTDYTVGFLPPPEPSSTPLVTHGVPFRTAKVSIFEQDVVYACYLFTYVINRNPSVDPSLQTQLFTYVDCNGIRQTIPRDPGTYSTYMRRPLYQPMSMYSFGVIESHSWFYSSVTLNYPTPPPINFTNVQGSPFGYQNLGSSGCTVSVVEIGVRYNPQNNVSVGNTLSLQLISGSSLTSYLNQSVVCGIVTDLDSAIPYDSVMISGYSSCSSCITVPTPTPTPTQTQTPGPWVVTPRVTATVQCPVGMIPTYVWAVRATGNCNFNSPCTATQLLIQADNGGIAAFNETGIVCNPFYIYSFNNGTPSQWCNGTTLTNRNSNLKYVASQQRPQLIAAFSGNSQIIDTVECDYLFQTWIVGTANLDSDGNLYSFLPFTSAWLPQISACTVPFNCNVNVTPTRTPNPTPTPTSCGGTSWGEYFPENIFFTRNGLSINSARFLVLSGTPQLTVGSLEDGVVGICNCQYPYDWLDCPEKNPASTQGLEVIGDGDINFSFVIPVTNPQIAFYSLGDNLSFTSCRFSYFDGFNLLPIISGQTSQGFDVSCVSNTSWNVSPVVPLNTGDGVLGAESYFIVSFTGTFQSIVVSLSGNTTYTSLVWGIPCALPPTPTPTPTQTSNCQICPCYNWMFTPNPILLTGTTIGSSQTIFNYSDCFGVQRTIALGIGNMGDIFCMAEPGPTYLQGLTGFTWTRLAACGSQNCVGTCNCSSPNVRWGSSSVGNFVEFYNGVTASIKAPNLSTIVSTGPLSDTFYSQLDCSVKPSNQSQQFLRIDGGGLYNIRFSSAVSNPLMVIMGLGNSSQQGSIQTNVGFNSNCLDNLTLNLLTRTILGNNGFGIVQFTGSVTNLTFTFTPPTTGAQTVWISLGLPCTPLSTPTPTPTLTQTTTPSITQTSTPTGTNQPTSSPTSTPTLTPTISESSSPGSSPTVTPSVTMTMTPTKSVTPTNTASSTPVPTLTPTCTGSTQTCSTYRLLGGGGVTSTFYTYFDCNTGAAVSVVVTTTTRVEICSRFTPVWSVVNGISTGISVLVSSGCGTYCSSLTATLTPTPTSTVTPTMTLTPTRTQSATSTPTPTLSNTPTLTATLTQTATPTSSEGSTPQPTPTNTSTPTRTITPTPSPTIPGCTCVEYSIVSPPKGEAPLEIGWTSCFNNSVYSLSNPTAWTLTSDKPQPNPFNLFACEGSISLSPEISSIEVVGENGTCKCFEFFINSTEYNKACRNDLIVWYQCCTGEILQYQVTSLNFTISALKIYSVIGLSSSDCATYQYLPKSVWVELGDSGVTECGASC